MDFLGEVALSVHHIKGYIRSLSLITGIIDLDRLTKSGYSPVILLFFPFHTPFVINWMLCPPQFICWTPKTHGIGKWEAFWRWLHHEDETLMNGISAFVEETPESSLAHSAMWGGQVSRQLSMDQVVTLTRHQVCLCLYLELSSLLNYEK